LQQLVVIQKMIRFWLAPPTVPTRLRQQAACLRVGQHRSYVQAFVQVVVALELDV